MLKAMHTEAPKAVASQLAPSLTQWLERYVRHKRYECHMIWHVWDMYWRCLPVALMRTSGARSLGCCDGEERVGHRVALGAHALGVVPGTLIGALLEDVPSACPGRLLTCANKGAVARSGRVGF